MKKLITLAFACISILCLAGCGKEAASVGIIGGADGPTVIFVASSIDWTNVLAVIGIIAVAVVAAIVIYRYKKKK